MEYTRRIEIFDEVAAEAKEFFGDISEEAFNWTPSPKIWSAAACLEHLILTNGPYLELLDKVIQGTYRKRFYERMPLLPKLFGGMLLNTVSPTQKRKVKTFGPFRPQQTTFDLALVDQFVAQQTKLKDAYLKIEELPSPPRIVSSPISKAIIFSLEDALDIVVLHEQRHLLQAQRVLKDYSQQHVA